MGFEPGVLLSVSRRFGFESIRGFTNTAPGLSTIVVPVAFWPRRADFEAAWQLPSRDAARGELTSITFGLEPGF